MAIDDIYKHKAKYEKFISNLDRLLGKPRRGKYYCKNKENLKYFRRLIKSFEVNDLSYHRRMKVLWIMTLLTYYIECDLKDVDKKASKDDFIIIIRNIFSSTQIKRTSAEFKTIAKILFGDKIPNFFDLKVKVDKSRQNGRKDKLTYEEFDRIMKFFSNDIVMQSYLSLAFESLGRPQEILYTKIKNLELYDNYAFIHVSEHGKEGTKKLISIDSYPYLIKMLNKHRDRNNENAYLFLNKYGKQLTPSAINKKIKSSCNQLRIDKPITAYSLKRFGVTFRRLNGDNDVTIQRIAGWTSTRQLQTYDLSNQDDVFKIELAKRGLIKDVTLKEHYPKTKTCEYCGERVGFSESSCPKCYNLMDKDLIKKRIEAREKPHEFLNQIMDDEVIELLLKKAKEKGINIS